MLQAPLEACCLRAESWSGRSLDSGNEELKQDSRIRITIPQNNAGFIGAVISAYSPPQAVVEVANFHCSLLLSLIIA